jgi:hypothetical protein
MAVQEQYQALMVLLIIIQAEAVVLHTEILSVQDRLVLVEQAAAEAVLQMLQQVVQVVQVETQAVLVVDLVMEMLEQVVLILVAEAALGEVVTMTVEQVAQVLL